MIAVSSRQAEGGVGVTVLVLNENPLNAGGPTALSLDRKPHESAESVSLSLVLAKEGFARESTAAACKYGWRLAATTWRSNELSRAKVFIQRPARPVRHWRPRCRHESPRPSPMARHTGGVVPREGSTAAAARVNASNSSAADTVFFNLPTPHSVEVDFHGRFSRPVRIVMPFCAVVAKPFGVPMHGLAKVSKARCLLLYSRRQAWLMILRIAVRPTASALA